MKNDQSVLFLTHVGEMGGAEAKMISIAKSVEGEKKVYLFQSGSLEQKIKQEGLDVSVLEMPEAVSTFKRENGMLSALKLIPLMMGYIRKLSRVCRNYDVVVCMSQKSFVLTSLSKVLKRKKIVWFMNDLLSEDHFNRFLIKFLIVLSRLSANVVVLNSESSRKAWLDAGGTAHNIELIYSGIDTQKFESLDKTGAEIQAIKAKYTSKSAPLVGMFGRITPWKGQHVFIDALAQIDNVHGVIVGEAQFGEEEYKQELEQLIEKHGLQDRISFAGHVDNIPHYMAACDVITHCSTSAEPFGRVIVESMLAKTPVIATNAGGAQEIILDGETGFLYPIGDDARLAELISKCLEMHSGQDDPLVMSAYERAKQNYSSAKMVEQFHDILKNV
ncbi:MAG: glycosyltransferase [Alcanivorax sp.]